MNDGSRGEVDAADAVRESRAFDELSFAADCGWWTESRPKDGDTRRLVRWHPRLGVGAVTPPGFEVGTGIHAYGGGSYAVAPSGMWCAAAEGGVYRFDERSGPRLVHPALAVPGATYGDLTVHGGELLCVRESVDDPDAGDALVAVAFDGHGEPRVLARTRGFFAAPRATGTRLAWLRWDVDQMPWDGTQLWVASYRPDGKPTEAVIVAGDRQESVLEPRWGPRGDLYFVSDRSGWWNLYRWDGSQVHPVAPMAAECAATPWELGYSSYVFLADRRLVLTVQEGPRHSLLLVEPDGRRQRLDLPYTSFKPYLTATGPAPEPAQEPTVGVIASSPTLAPHIVRLHLGSTPPRAEVITRAQPAGLDGVAVSTPQELTVPTAEGRAVLAVLYPPIHARRDWRAPLIVRAHPGPTAASVLRLDWQVQFFTGRGIAVVDVDYRGSTGYGRRFRESLYGRWGIDDVADCCAVADHLVRAGRAIAGQVFIRGASAGGYTALRAVSSDGPFSAATAVSAIVDPDRWMADAPRFQRPHAARLRSGAGRIRAEEVRTPVLLIHGDGDAVAPPADVVALANALRTHTVPHRLLVLGDAGHTIATSADAAAALRAELRLYETVIHGEDVTPEIW